MDSLKGIRSMPKFNETEKRQIEEALFTSGKELFSKMGLKKVNVDEIIAPVGISHGSFYNFYKNKEHLFMAINLHCQEELFTTIRGDYKAGSSFYKVLNELIKRYIAHPILNQIVQIDIKRLQKKVPAELWQKNSELDLYHLGELQKELKLTFAYPLETTVKTLQALAYTGLLLQKEPAGDEALQVLIAGTARELVKES